ncbi:RNA polymerase sigma-70 factor [Dyadobacter sp. CY345]|uniref:RNA polymerase sigma factor n=1 Tax=Dyadobacter sp. CY345 TaxID=2909335 RepID=UPI001F33FD9D|nr:RNA polymerase sigma-70 factor [Dyadobacter sp. CY345]MCF2443246.1 RNA polymerase sigma-70 factor [Dyadobacter sp. CY345]
MQGTLVSDKELVNSISEGDESAFQEIYRRYWYKLFMMAKRKLIFEEDAQEIVQDIFVDLWERRFQVQIEELNNFLVSAVKYQILNHIRARIVRQQYSNDSFHTVDHNDNDTEDQLALTDLTTAIASGLATLPQKSREIFTLNRLEGLSVREIAARLNIPERTIEYHITQSLRMMRQHLKDFVLIITAIVFAS